jgi:SAM-dependent methyltransferase
VNPAKVPPVSIVRCHNPSPVVHRGDVLHATIELTNNTKQAQSLFVWFDVASFDREPLTTYPFFKPVELSLEAGETVAHDAYLLVPHSAGTNDYLLRFAVGPTEATPWDERFLEISVIPQRELCSNNCNLCGAEVREENVIRRDPSIRLAKCGSCGLVFDFDMKDTHSLFYQFGKACGGGLRFQKNTPTILEEYDRKNELVLGVEIARINRETGSSGKRLLDFGCGTGGLLAEARRSGFHVCGVETHEAAVAFARRARDLPVYASIEELRQAQGDDPFDVVVARHTVEHVSNPKQTFREFRGLLRPGGLLVIIVPHFNFFARRILPNSMPKFSYGLIHKGHQYYFTKNTLSEYLKGAGFPDIEIRYSILGGFLSRWTQGAEGSGDPGMNRVVAGTSKAFSRLLHISRLSPVLTAYAR